MVLGAGFVPFPPLSSSSPVFGGDFVLPRTFLSSKLRSFLFDGDSDLPRAFLSSKLRSFILFLTRLWPDATEEEGRLGEAFDGERFGEDDDFVAERFGEDAKFRERTGEGVFSGEARSL